MFKKVLSILIVFSLMTVFVPAIYAANDAVVSVSSVSGIAGETVEVSVAITNNPGVAAFSFVLNFDRELVTPVSFEQNIRGMLISNLQFVDGEDLEFVTAIWASVTNFTEDVTLFTVTFKISEEAQGNIEISMTGEMINENLGEVTVRIEGGSIEILTPETEGSNDDSNQPPETDTSGDSSHGTILPPNQPGSNPNLTFPGNQQTGDGSSTFDDITNYPWAAGEINALAADRIIRGTSETTFSPGNNISRADYMILLVRMLDINAEFAHNFDDVSPGAYYYNEIGAARELGFATGIGNNQFAPRAEIMRQDVFVLAYRILRQKDAIEPADLAVLEQFNDSALIADYALEALAALVTSGLVMGNENYINPRGLTTRAETAVFIYRIRAMLA
ncbi:MAG: S-layer homology domain-containing protein [Oscillospiraceae bacterium]|nr:S-layer homology domain-containing protein [Oscillospiraceae bacterium]